MKEAHNKSMRPTARGGPKLRLVLQSVVVLMALGGTVK